MFTKSPLQTNSFPVGLIPNSSSLQDFESSHSVNPGSESSPITHCSSLAHHSFSGGGVDSKRGLRSKRSPLFEGFSP